jgi:type II secretory pathway pseudopilin PulG
MIVIAIIGMIATVLYPQLTGYYSRGRDATRLWDIKILSANFQNYARGQSVYPSNINKDGEISYCISDIAGWIDALPQFRDKQFSKLWWTGSIQKDPLSSNPGLSPCTMGGSYFYSQLSGAGGMYGLVAARMENQTTWANYSIEANLKAPGSIDSMLKAQPLDKSGNDDDKIYLLITN